MSDPNGSKFNSIQQGSLDPDAGTWHPVYKLGLGQALPRVLQRQGAESIHWLVTVLCPKPAWGQNVSVQIPALPFLLCGPGQLNLSVPEFLHLGNEINDNGTHLL